MQSDSVTLERFGEDGLKVLLLGKEEMVRLGHNLMGSEAILLGILASEQSKGACVLQNLGISHDGARELVEKITGRGPGRVASDFNFTPRAKRVLNQAIDEAVKFGSEVVQSEHLLLGIEIEGEGVAHRVLESFGIKISDIRPAVTKLLKETK